MKPLFSLLLAGAIAAAQSTTPAPAGAAASTKIPGFDPHALDRTANPCEDFYQFACGTWMKTSRIPPDRGRWGRFDELLERNQAVLHDILEKAATAAPAAGRNAVDRKIGDFYASCMDEQAIQAKGLEPLKPEFDRIRAIQDRDGVVAEMILLHRAGVGVMFDSGSQQDFRDASKMIASIDQGGLGMPDRDYYLKDDDKSTALRKEYLAHVRRMFVLAGSDEQTATGQAHAVLAIETALARASLDRVSRRDPSKLDHMMAVKDLDALAPGLYPWAGYLKGIGAPPVESLNVAVPEFFHELSRMVGGGITVDNWKTYLTWQVLHASAGLLPRAYVDENFAFFGKALTGAQELQPRWKRCVQMTDRQLGEALGQAYVERTFGAEGKARMLKMVEALEAALARDIRNLDWMTPATREQAAVKLKAIANKIGYPDKWRDYSALEVVRGDALGNAERGRAFEVQRDLAKIGKPVDRSEWGMTPPTVNAYYNPQMNNINFPAGILQPPFFDRDADDAVNFGGIGAVIGHELTHGFDDEGRQFDASGALRDWWTAQDATAFGERAQCIVDEYSGFEAVPGLHLNGKLTLGENVADNGGLRIALMALEDVLERHSAAKKGTAKIDGFTPEQRLFLGWGQIWCQKQTEESARMRVAVDPHSPGRWRVNGVVRNMPEFQKAFHCKPADAMVAAPKACRVW